jgi:peptide/nickel transport system permease protein
MFRYAFERLLMLIPVILGVSLLIFVIMDLAPGDAVDYLASDDATAEEIQQIRSDLGLDRPLLERYGKYMLGMAKGDLGTSYVSKKDVFHTFISKFPATLVLASAGIIVAIILSIPLGIYSAVHRGGLGDNISMVLAILGLSMPNFWLGLLLIIGFSLKLGWFPSGDMSGISSIVLPAITLGTGLTAMLTRTTRSSMLDALSQDYLRTARAKGVSERVVINKHALKNALIPIITVIGAQLGTCLGGSVITETVFSWPGVGRLIIDSLNSRDIPMVTGSLILVTIAICIVILIIDLLYVALDPRLKAQYSRGGDS